MSKEGTVDFGKMAALYAPLYEGYSENFSDIYFSAAKVVDSVDRIKKRGAPRKWGYYQKYAADDPTDPSEWDEKRDPKKGAKRHMNWEAAVWEAREDLAKLPVNDKADGPDPDKPNQRAKNLLDHLDTAVRIALFDKHQQGKEGDRGSGIEVKVIVGFPTKRWRRHELTTKWDTYTNPGNDPTRKYERLTITMICPYGGWVGTAYWPYQGARKFTHYIATYVVPDPPKDYGQILFVFNGLESVPDPKQPKVQPGILQPVLQWTSKEKKWAIRSWYVPASHKPEIEDLPGASLEMKYTNPNAAAWTRAETVDPGDQLMGIITWDVDQDCYVSKFLLRGEVWAELAVPGVLPLTYPVAVVEAYSAGDAVTRVPPDGLVDITMTKVVLQLDGSPDPVEPDWIVGSDGPTGTGHIKYGTNRLQSYKIKPKNKGSELDFAVKKGAGLPLEKNVPADRDDRIEINLPGGERVVVGPGVDGDALLRVLKVLAQR